MPFFPSKHLLKPIIKFPKDHFPVLRSIRQEYLFHYIPTKAYEVLFGAAQEEESIFFSSSRCNDVASWSPIESDWNTYTYIYIYIHIYCDWYELPWNPQHLFLPKTPLHESRSPRGPVAKDVEPCPPSCWRRPRQRTKLVKLRSHHCPHLRATLSLECLRITTLRTTPCKWRGNCNDDGRFTLPKNQN